MVLQVSTISGLDELEALADSWRELLAAAHNDVPFLLPEWLCAWWEAFRQEGALIRDSLHVKVARDGDRLVGFLPLMLTERPRFGPLRARALGFMGADRYITELRSPVVHPDYQVEVARAFAQDLLAERTWDWTLWEGLDRQSPFARELERHMQMEWGPEETASILPLAATWDEFRGGLKRNIKESLRRCTNSLKRDGLTAKLQVAASGPDIARDLHTFFRLHALRAEQGGVTHPDRFAVERTRRFLSEVCARMAPRGIPRVFTLTIDGVPVASRVAFLLPGCLYFYYSGFEPEFAKYSVATTVVAEALKYAIELGVPRAHLSMGSDVSKSRWGPQTQVVQPAICVRPRLLSRVARDLYVWGRTNATLEGALGRILPKRQFD